MEIKKTQEGTNLVLVLDGRLDTKAAPELEAALDGLSGIERLTLDMSGVAYIASAGLRVLLSAQKIMNKQGSMMLENVCEDAREVFDMTGFSDILTIAS